MLIIARTTGVQTVVMNGNSNTRVIWKCLGRKERENRKVLSRCLRRRCEVDRQVVPDSGTRNRKRPLADCRETNRLNVQKQWSAKCWRDCVLIIYKEPKGSRCSDSTFIALRNSLARKVIVGVISARTASSKSPLSSDFRSAIRSYAQKNRSIVYSKDKL